VVEPKSRAELIAQYERSHQHPFNRLCHRFGIPLIAGSLLVALVGWFDLRFVWAALALFVAGWILQFVGHAIEGRPPEFLSDRRFLLVGLRWWWWSWKGRDAKREVGGEMKREQGIVRVLLIGVLIVVLLVVGYVALMLSWSYSDGDRAGKLQKFSRKGYVFKTWEGELAITLGPGIAPEIWQFSCREDDVAQKLQQLMGQHVVLRYEEHIGVPVSWFAETRYHVVGARPAELQPGY
jgi:hypothetical protein